MLILTNLITFFPLLLLLHCLAVFLFKRWLGPVGTFYGSILVFCICLICAFNDLYFILLNGNYFFVDFGRWFFCLDLIDSHLVFCVDSLALICAMLVLILTALALYFGVEYMYRDAFINRLLYLLNMFATSVVFLFFCYDFFLIILCWECIGLFSFLLVNFYSMRIYTIKAAMKTFVFARISDMFMFLAFILAIIVFNTTDLSLIFLQIPFFLFHYIFIGTLSVHFLTVFAFSIALSGVIKAAQFFFHVWLPDAMEAPTPASALIHSSTLVIAGIFLIIRFSVLFEFSLLVDYFLALLGAVTLAFGAITAIFQTDIKKLVAFSTISQIGYLVCGCGFCCYEEVLLYLIIHALNKAFLFILVGYIVHYFNGNTDMRQMGGLYLYSFDVAVFLFGVCFNLAGLPYSAGFFVKEFLVFQLLRDGFLALIVRACWLVSFLFTPIYMFILVFIVLYGPKKGVLTTYRAGWHVLLAGGGTRAQQWRRQWWPRLQFTAVTARPTSFLLFSFWCFFYFCGETLLLLLFNFTTIQDFVGSHFFFFLKTHIVFLLNATSVFLNNIIYFYIVFFSLAGILFLMNFKYTFFYNYVDYSWYYEMMFIACTVVFLGLWL